MQTPVSIMRIRGRRFHRLAGIALFLAAFVLCVGCGSGGKEAKNQVTGKVTLDNKPVAGVVGFVYPEKEMTSPIGADGSYQIIDPPPGQVKVYVKGGLGGGAPQAKGSADVPKGEMPKDTLGG